MRSPYWSKIWLFFCILSVLPAYAGPADFEQATQSIESNWGQILSSEQAPHLYRMIDRIYGRISAAAEEDFKGMLISNRVRIVSSQTENARVVTFRQPHQNLIENEVFITTGLLQKLLEDSGQKLSLTSIQEQEHLVAGVLSHEQAHPVDIHDQDGLINKKYGRQAAELRTDLDAIPILRRANYPEDSLYWALQKTRDNQKEQTFSGLSTHPQDDIRATSSRLGLTRTRLWDGTVTSQPVVENMNYTNTIQELQYFTKPENSGPAAKIKNLKTAVSTLKEMARNSDAIESTEFQQIFIRYLSLVNAQGDRISESDKKLIFDLHTHLFNLISKESSNSANKSNMKSVEKIPDEWLSKDSPFRGLTRFEALEKVSFFNSEEYLNRFGSMIDQSLSRFPFAIIRWPDLGYVFPDHLLYNKTSAKIINQLKEKTINNDFYDHAAEWFQRLPEKKQNQFVNEYHTSISGKVPIDREISFLSDYHCHGTALSPFESYSDSFFEKARARKTEMSIEMRDEVKKSAQHIWENRKLWIYLELGRDSGVDWESIFHELNLTEKQGYEMLTKSFYELTSSSQYIIFLENNELLNWTGSLSGLPKWLPYDALPYLEGKHLTLDHANEARPHLRNKLRNANAVLNNVKKKQVIPLRNYFLENSPEFYREIYQKEFTERMKIINATNLSDEELLRQIFSIDNDIVQIEEILGRADGDVDILDFFVDGIISLPISNERKKALILTGFDNFHAKENNKYWRAFNLIRGPWLLGIQDKNVLTKLVENLRKNEIIKNPSEFIEGQVSVVKDMLKNNVEPKYRKEYLEHLARDHKKLIEQLYIDLAQEMRNIETLPHPQRARAFSRLMETLFDPWSGEIIDASAPEKSIIRELKNQAVDTLSRLSLEPDEQLRLLQKISLRGSTIKTDQALRELLNNPKLSHNKSQMQLIRKMLVQEQVGDVDLQVEQANRFLKPRIQTMSQVGYAREELINLIEEVNRLVPKGGLKKDAIIEDLAWKLKIMDVETLHYLDTQKMTNFKKENPILVNWASQFSEYLHEFTSSEKLDLMDYLTDPKVKPFPSSIKLAVQRITEEKLKKIELGKSIRESENFSHRLLRERDEVLERIEAFAYYSSAEEKIPIFDLILGGGREPIIDQPQQLDRVFSKIMKITPDSPEHQRVSAYLKVCPSYERSVSVAYLLSQSGSDKSSARAIAEIFDAPGKKAGQFASTFQLFDKETNQELADLKETARPMTRYEILKEMHAQLTPEEWAQIKDVKEVVGSASLKTVVKVELKDGRTVAMMIQHPMAEARVKQNLKMLKAYIEELSKDGANYDAELVKSMEKAIEEQLQVEMDMRNEAGKIRDMKALYDEYNRVAAKDLKGWKFEVPGLIEGFQTRKGLLFVEFADGVSFQNIQSSGTQSLVGEQVGQSTIYGLNKKGIIEADRHTGNFKFDEQSKKIWVLDIAQAQDFAKSAYSFKRDEIDTIGKMLRALSEKNAERFLDSVLRFASPPINLNAQARGALSSEIQALLNSDKAFQDQAIQLVKVLSKHHVTLDRRISFGLFKGLVTLTKEGYLSPNQFMEALSASVRSVAKAPLVVIDTARECVIDAYKVLQNAFRLPPSVH